MEILILHISDIHLTGVDDYSDLNVSSIVNALPKSGNVSIVFVIVSGDIAFSGYKKQYDAAQLFLKDLQARIQEKYMLDKIYFELVPGNHDLNYSIEKLTTADLQSIIAQGKMDESVRNEITKMRAFYNFAKRYDCFKDSESLVDIHIHEFGNKKVRINLINTGAFSLLEEDQGLHYLPKTDLEKLDSYSDEDFVFTIMHHPHHWYCADMKKTLEEIIYGKSDMIFMGHEHMPSDMSIDNQYASVVCMESGELSNKGNWKNSEFYAGILDVENRKYEYGQYTWDWKNSVYISRDSNTITIKKARLGENGLALKKEYIQELMQDSKNMICEDFSEYFVFPLLEETDGNFGRRDPVTISTLDNFMKEVNQKKRLIIQGGTGSGKTFLAKQVFKKLSEQVCTLFINASDIHGDNYEQLLRDFFENEYSQNIGKYEKFRQMNNKALVIDNFEQIDPARYDQFHAYVKKEFDIILQFGKGVIELDLTEKIRQQLSWEGYSIFNIEPFYYNKRKELVEKVVKIMRPQNIMLQDSLIAKLCDALEKQRMMATRDPDFVVQFTKYYCINIGESVQSDSNVFSKVFEANLVNLLEPHISQMSVDKIFIILDKIAYDKHINKEYSMSQKDIVRVIEHYNSEFDSNVDYVDFIRVLLDSGILVRKGDAYQFAERNYYAYFVAREIKRQCQEEQDYNEFIHALKYSYFDINADIILFVTYITDNIILVRKFMDQAEQYALPWVEFKLTGNSINYLAVANQLTVERPKEEDRRKREEDIIEYEKKQEKEKRQNVVDNIYGDEDTELSIIDELLREISLLSILSRMLPSFEHMMKKQDKERCVRLIYSLPLKIFNQWAKQVDKDSSFIIEDIKTLQEYEYRKLNKEKLYLDMSDKDRDREALKYLQYDSISLLMELMNSSMSNATKQSTLSCLDAFAYHGTFEYEMAHLMSLDRRDAVGEFAKKVEELNDKYKQGFSKFMIRRVARHYVITSRKISKQTIQRLNDKLWGNQLSNRGILIQREKRKNR